VALAFAATLLASGLSSAAVGTYSGQVVMEGFVDVRLSPTIRRTVTMLPALALLAIGTSPTSALIASQVVLSFGIPFALYALLRVARDRQVLGNEAIGRGMTAVLGGISAIVVCLNVILLVDTIAG
jgi:manganese transport protein